MNTVVCFSIYYRHRNVPVLRFMLMGGNFHLIFADNSFVLPLIRFD